MRPTILGQRGPDDPTNYVQIQGLDDERELSTIVIDCEYSLPSILDHLDQIYSHRSHKRCINLTYLTLLSMICAILFWMIYWMTYEYCQRSLNFEDNSFICKTVPIFQVLILISLGFSPIFFILMIIFWMIFACSNPIDRIRKKFIGFKLEGNRWKNQLDYYSSFQKKPKCFHCSPSSRIRNQLLHRNFGYIILSPYGIIFDEFFLLTSSSKHGIYIEEERILKLEFNQCSRNELFIYLPENIFSPQLLEELRNLLRINIDTMFSNTL